MSERPAHTQLQAVQMHDAAGPDTTCSCSAIYCCRGGWQVRHDVCARTEHLQRAGAAISCIDAPLRNHSLGTEQLSHRCSHHSHRDDCPIVGADGAGSPAQGSGCVPKHLNPAFSGSAPRDSCSGPPRLQIPPILIWGVRRFEHPSLLASEYGF